MPKWIYSIAIMLCVISIFVLSPQIARADDPVGAKLFGTYCAACHGAGGTGGGAPAIGSPQFLSANNDALITRVMSEGNISKGMPAWSKAKGGTLTDDQITSIVAYLRSLATTTATAPAPNAPPSAPSAYLVQTKLILSESVNANNEIVLNASLQDHTGYPVADASLSFNRATTWGVVDLGSAKTGANGIATLVMPEAPANARDVAVAFKGDKKFEASTGKIAVVPQDETGLAYATSSTSGVQLSLKEPILAPQGSLITSNPPLVPAVFMVLILGSVWSVYSYVVYQIYGISKDGRGATEISKPIANESRENIFSSGRR